MSSWEVITGDCLDVMPTLEANSVDTIITDPPYGLSFMGKDWDHGIPGPRFWIEALRVAKPGAMLLAFGGSRTFHRLAVAIEDAGWEIRDTILWLYGSGFPKSHDISKAIDKAAGVEREVLPGKRHARYNTVNGTTFGGNDPRADHWNTITAPATPAAQEWSGYGTALKPAHEPIIVAMKPLDGTFAENAQRWGVAGYWIDGGRVGTGEDKEAGGCHGSIFGNNGKGAPVNSLTGRWPANVITDGSDEVLAGFPVTTSGGSNGTRKLGPYSNGRTWSVSETPGASVTNGLPPDTGSAARFFYCAKSSRAERNRGLEISPIWLDSIELIWHNTNTNVLSEVLVWEKQDRNQSTDWSGEALPVRVISEDMTPQAGDNALPMSLNGSGITGLSLMAIRYTTSTGTSATIESKTLSLLAHLSTSASMEDAIKTGKGFGLSLVESVAFINLLKLITTKGVTAYPRGAKLAPKKTPQSTSVKDALLSAHSANIHSTVKPLALMRYLARLTKTPTGGVVLDPFAGSGSTGCAAVLEGRSFIGIEQDAEYADIARRRIAHWQEQGAQLELL